MSKHQAELPVLYCSIPLPVHFTHSSINVSVLLSQLGPPPLSPRVHLSLLYIYTYSGLANRLIITICLYSI